MNQHIKLAIVIAPFLAIGGYIATDYYDTYQVNKKRYHTLTVEGQCDIDTGPCLLKGAGLILEFSKKGEVTNLETNVPLDTAAIGMLGSDEHTNLTPDASKKNWSVNTSAYMNSVKAEGNAIRVLVSAKDHFFFSEFSNTK